MAGTSGGDNSTDIELILDVALELLKIGKQFAIRADDRNGAHRRTQGDAALVSCSTALLNECLHTRDLKLHPLIQRFQIGLREVEEVH